MVPVPTYKNLPVFGTAASLVVPIPETYLGGFLPGQVFPAEYENWLMNYITDNSLTSETTATSLAAEVITILTAASISPIPASTGQLYQALNALYATVGDLASEASTRAAADTALQDEIDSRANVFVRASAGTYNIPTLPLQIPVTAVYRVVDIPCTIKTPVESGTYAGYFSCGASTTTEETNFFRNLSQDITIGTVNGTGVAIVIIVKES